MAGTGGGAETKKTAGSLGSHGEGPGTFEKLRAAQGWPVFLSH